MRGTDTRAIIILLGAVAGAFIVGRLSSSARLPLGRQRTTGFEPARIDLGRQPWYTSVPFTAKFVNRRDEAAIIAAVKSACGCTGIDAKRYVGRTVEPGESLELAGELSTRHALGQRTAEVELMLTSGAIYVLTLEYEGYATYACQPQSLEFEGVDLDSEDEVIQSAIFTSQTARVVELVPDAPWLEAGYHDRGGGQTELAVRIAKENLPHGKNYATLNVVTSDPFKPEFSIRVMAEGVAQVRAIPGHLILRNRQDGIVRFVDRNGESVEIESVEPEPADFSIYRQPGSSTLRLRYVGKEAPGAGARVLWVTTSAGTRTRFLVTVLEPKGGQE